MQKNRFFGRWDVLCPVPKATNWRFLMRVSSCVIATIFLTGHLLVASPGIGQKNADTKLDLDFRNTIMKKVFKAIESKADVVIMYEFTHKEVNKKVDISVKDVSVRDVLNLLLNNTGLQWKIRDNVIRIQEASDTTATPTGGLSPWLTLPALDPTDPISGMVRDTSGAPLSGATVYNIRTKKSVQTNAKGEFNIEGNEGDILQLSFIGYENQSFSLCWSFIVQI